MKSASLDTSVVVRLLTNTPEDQARKALDAFTTKVRSGAVVFVSDLTIAETYFALQHHYRVPKAEAIRLLSSFLSDSGVTPTGAAADMIVTPRLATLKPGFVDRLIHAEGIAVAEEFLTFETAAKRLPHTRVL